jgi:uncharacterized protein
MTTGQFGRCMGGSPTLCAMTRLPAAFDGVRCLVSPQPVTPLLIVKLRLVVMGLGDRLDDFDTYMRLRRSAGLARPDAIGGRELQWIEGTTARFDGYLESRRPPEPMPEGCARYMS